MSKLFDKLHTNLRLCRLQLWPNYDGFGFYLEYSLKRRPFVETIEPYSPAASSGLQAFDTILAINDEDITSYDSEQIIDMIQNARDNHGHLELLVIDQHSHRLSLKKDIEFDRSLASVIDTPDAMPTEYEEYFKYQPRTCELSLDETNSSFGFEIESYEKKIGAYIRTICSNTPASNTILRSNDIIIEINDKRIEKKDRKSIIKKLSKAKLQKYLKLYVMDVETYEYYRSNKVSLSSKKQLENINRYHDRRSIESNSSDHHETVMIRKKDYLSLRTHRHFKPSIQICKGDLITQKTDVIVICSSSQYLCDSVCQAGGPSLSNVLEDNSNESLIAVRASGNIRSKQIYFLPWELNSDPTILRESIGKFVSDAIEKAAKEHYRSIAFPAIGCGRYGCSVDFIARTMIEQADQLLFEYSISVLFVIQSDRMDIYDDFYKQMQLLQSTRGVAAISRSIGKGTIVVEQGDITKEKIDVIIDNQSSERSNETMITTTDDVVHNAYMNEQKKNPNSILIETPPGALSCKRIFFLRWTPVSNEEMVQQSILDLLSIVIQHMMSHNFTSIAFPPIGCDQPGCSVPVIVKAMVNEMKNQITKRNLPWLVKFIIQPNQTNIYDEFCKQVLVNQCDAQLIQLPPTWEQSRGTKMRFVVSSTSEACNSIIVNFDQAMQGRYTQIIRIERIQNKRWYLQYLAHSTEFRERLNTDTERRLYHGCSEQAVNSIIKTCFNRGLAGVNGTVYGVGAYFSSNAAYSHGFTAPNTNGERCMFVARVLIGKTVKGDTSMKIPPVGFDSTTDGTHIFVTYHDDQAYAEYLIIYK